MKFYIKKIIRALYNRYLLVSLLKFGISWKHILRLYKGKAITNSELFEKQIQISDSFWHLHGLKEIFLDEVYKFSSDNNTPYIIDCGANIGLSVIYFKRLYPLSHIDCFEPDAKIFKNLQYNVNQFNNTNVRFVNKAVWIHDKGVSFSSDGAVGGHISNSENENKIQSVRLKSLLHTTVDFLKIDIEGAEFDVIKDCESELAHVKNIFIEYHSSPNNEQMLGELLIILKQSGFKIYIKEAWENMTHPFVNTTSPCYDLQLNIFGYRK